MMIVLTVGVVMLFSLTQALPSVMRVGAMFMEEQRGSSLELAFKYAVYRVNEDPNLLPNTTILYSLDYVPTHQSFLATKKACGELNAGVQAIFGPCDPLIGSYVGSICDAVDIPHLEARLDVEAESKEFSINLYPAYPVLAKAYRDMMKFLNWTHLAIIYEEDIGLLKLQDLVRDPPIPNSEVFIRQSKKNNFTEVLQEINAHEMYNILVDVTKDSLPTFISEVNRLDMNIYKYHYLLTTFDLEVYDLDVWKSSFINVTAFRLVDFQRDKVKEVLDDMMRFSPQGKTILNKDRKIQAEQALMYDAVFVFALGLQELERSASLRLANLSCEAEVPWNDGSSLFNYINSVEFRGMTGPITLKEGRRTNLKLDLLKLRRNSQIVKVGEWTPEGGINVTDIEHFYDVGPVNVTLLVTTIVERPYVMVHHPNKNMTGNDRFYGFCIDLLEIIAKKLEFDYILELVPDGKYGAQDKTTGRWNGMVAQLLQFKADLAVGSMTINYARESVIDFTKPFMNLGISILFKVPEATPTRLFSFMNPLAVEIWLYMVAAYILVSFTMFIVARFSPYEWSNPHPCNLDSDVVENQFSLGNSFWFMIGTLMQQNADLNPKALSTRIVGGMWWFFTLIMISSYTANLAAFLTVERMITPIESAEDLAEQSTIEYGTLQAGSTMTFFRDSKIETYQKMWRFMENRKSMFTSTYEDGIRRVLEGNYAFVMESTMLDYIVQRNCNLTQIGGLLDSKGYGIAAPMGSIWKDKISLVILELQEKGVVHMLYNTWWANADKECKKKKIKNGIKVNSLSRKHIGGVFVVLLCGLAVAFTIAIIEFCWNSKRNLRADNDLIADSVVLPCCPLQQSLCSELAEEMCFAVRCCASRRRPALKRHCNRCNPHSTYVPANTADVHHIHIEADNLPMSGIGEMRKASCDCD